jgi:hypothetical protein
MRRAAAVVAAFLMAFAGVVAVPGATTAQAAGETAFEVHYAGEGETGIFIKWWPAASTLTVTINDPATFQSPDYQTVFVAEETEEGYGGGFNVEYEAKPGDVVIVTDGPTTKSHIVIDIRVISVKVDADQVLGTVAAPNSEVTVYTDAANRYFTAESSGNWMADFSVAGPDESLFDIVPGTSGGAEQFDTDHDSTVYDWQVPRPEGWQHNPVNGHAYLYVGDGMTWADAEEYAVSLGGHLVTINDAAENDWLIATFGTQYWMGMNDIAVEGTWVWASGEPVTYTNWHVGEPNDIGGEDGGVVSGPFFGQWNDEAVDGAQAFVVEVVPTLDQLLDDMVVDGRLPNEGVAISIMKQAEKVPLKALTNHLSDLVRRGVITQLTMDQVLVMVAG